MREQRTAYLLLAPTICVLAALLLYPFLYNVYLSVMNYTVGRESSFIGIDNYIEVFLDPTVQNALIVTFLFTAVALSVETLLGLLLAILFNRESKLSRAAVVLLLLPLVMTPVVSAATWKILYDPVFGFFNSVLRQLSLGTIDFLGNPVLALPSLVLIDVWQWTPFMMLVIVAGLKALPKSPMESASVDGASNVQTLAFITLPMLRPYIFVGIVFRLIEVIRVFDIIVATTDGGPGIATQTLNFYAFIMGFRYFHVSYSATLAVLLMLVTLVIAQFAFKMATRASRYE